jgi:predicted nicotinamide N-methyase
MDITSEAKERKLRQRARKYWPLAGMTLTLPGALHPYQIAQPAFPEDLLDELIARPARPASPRLAQSPHTTGIPTLRAAAAEARQKVDAGGHMPYWGLLWPSGLALAEELLRTAALGLSSSARRGAGARTERAGSAAVRSEGTFLHALELGCGLGVTAVAALSVGLQLTAADCFPEALAFCRYNTQRNTDRTPMSLLVDWRTETGRAALALAAPYDLLLAADVLYEEPDIALLLELAPRLVGSGGHFWLAEPGRRVSLKFVEAALARGWRDTTTVYERLWPPQGDYARVTIHQLIVA